MNKFALLVPLVALSTACNDAGGVWLLQLTNPTTVDNGVTCAENFIDAECRTANDPGNTDWTQTQEGSQSPGTVFAEIFDNADGTAILVVDGGTYLGDKESGVYTFSWEKFDNSSSTSSHASGYSETQTNDNSSLTELVFERSGDTLTGTTTVTTVRDQAWTETDTWTQMVGGPSNGQMNGFNAYVTGNTSNSYRDVECEAALCRVSVQSGGIATLELSGTRTELDHTDFIGVQGAGQDAGF